MGHVRFRRRSDRVLLIAAFGAALGWAAPAFPADCVFVPSNDVRRVGALLARFAGETHLPPILADQWDASLDGDRARITLPFERGSVVLSWQLDGTCAVVDARVDASPDYHGALPDGAAVARLAASFPTARPGSSGGIPAPVAGGLVAVALIVAAVVGFRLRQLRVLAVDRLRRVTAIDLIRLLGVVVIAGLLPWKSAEPASASIGSLSLITVLWLTMTGFFGYATARRDDWPAVAVFLLALGIRAGYARHGVEGDVLHFLGRRTTDSHSFVYTYYLKFIYGVARDPFRLQIHANAILAAVAALPLYLFVRRRTGDRMAALFVALFYAVHPILLQMAPTDSPYSLCFACWFSALALLGGSAIGAREMVGGALLLGIAATCRPEGGLFVPASLLLVDPLAVLRAAVGHVRSALASAGMLLGMLALEVYFVFSTHMGADHRLPVDQCTAAATLAAGLWSTDYNDVLIAVLVLVGALAGSVTKRLRIGLGAAAATLLVVWPFCGTTYGGYIILHRLSAACALQVIGAGVGVAWITSWLPGTLRRHWTAALPGVAAAIYLLVVHRHEIHDQIGLSDEFWMLRNHLAPGGVVEKNCKLVWVGRNMDTDIHDFEDVVPGMEGVRCPQTDCLAEVARGGCFYYMRGLNCFYSETPTKPECRAEGKTPGEGYWDCIDPDCVRVEGSLQLDLVEQRTVDVHSVWNYEHDNADPHFPLQADVALYRVVGMKRLPTSKTR